MFPITKQILGYQRLQSFMLQISSINACNSRRSEKRGDRVRRNSRFTADYLRRTARRAVEGETARKNQREASFFPRKSIDLRSEDLDRTLSAKGGGVIIQLSFLPRGPPQSLLSMVPIGVLYLVPR